MSEPQDQRLGNLHGPIGLGSELSRTRRGNSAEVTDKIRPRASVDIITWESFFS
jgi:hypothetical protein